jgi:hypothetical protein
MFKAHGMTVVAGAEGLIDRKEYIADNGSILLVSNGAYPFAFDTPWGRYVFATTVVYEQSMADKLKEALDRTLELKYVGDIDLMCTTLIRAFVRREPCGVRMAATPGLIMFDRTSAITSPEQYKLEVSFDLCPRWHPKYYYPPSVLAGSNRENSGFFELANFIAAGCYSSAEYAQQQQQNQQHT